MKILKIVLLSLLGLILAALAALFIFLKTFDLNRYLPQITKAATDAMGRPLAIDHAGLNISLQGIVLDLQGVRLSDVPPAASPLLQADKAHAKVEVMPLLTRRQIQISQVVLENIKVSLANGGMPVNVQIADVRAKVNDFSLDQPFDVVVDASFASHSDNIHAAGCVQLHAAQSSATITDLTVNSDLSQLNMSDIKAITAVLAQAPLPKSLSGQLQLNVPHLEAGAKGLGDTQANLTVSNIAGGTINADAQIKGGQLSGQSKINGVNIEDLLDMDALPVGIKGKLSSDATFSAAGLAPDVLVKSLKAQGTASISGGTIKKLNILKTILGAALGSIPGLADAAYQIINGELQNELGGPNMALDKAEAKFHVQDSTMFLDEMVASAKAFELNANGTVGFDLQTSIKTTLFVSQQLSDVLVKKVPEFGYLRDDSQRIHVDGEIRGTVPKVKFVPSVNVRQVGENAIIEEGGKQLQKVIEKNPQVGSILNSILGGGGDNTSTNSAVQQNADQSSTDAGPSESKSDKTKKMINNVLNSIFK